MARKKPGYEEGKEGRREEPDRIIVKVFIDGNPNPVYEKPHGAGVFKINVPSTGLGVGEHEILVAVTDESGEALKTEEGKFEIVSEKPEPLPPVSPEVEEIGKELDKLRQATRNSVWALRGDLRRLNSDLTRYISNLISKRTLSFRKSRFGEERGLRGETTRISTSIKLLRPVTKKLGEAIKKLAIYGKRLGRDYEPLFNIFDTLNKSALSINEYIEQARKLALVDTGKALDDSGNIVNLCKRAKEKIEEAAKALGIGKGEVSMDSFREKVEEKEERVTTE